MKYLNILLLMGLAATTAQANIVNVNLTRSGAPNEAGFTNWESDDNSLPSSLLLSFGDDSLTFSAPSTGINVAIHRPGRR